MKISIDILASEPKALVISLVLGAGHTVVPEDDADLVISDDSAGVLRARSKGRLTILFIWCRHVYQGYNLANAPVDDRFRMYTFEGYYPGVPTIEKMVRYLASLPNDDR